MAVTAVIAIADIAGKSASEPLRVRRLTVTADDDYPTGGFLVTGDLPTGEVVVGVVPQPATGNTNGKHGQYDYAAGKVLFLTGAGVEVANLTSIIGEAVELVVFSK